MTRWGRYLVRETVPLFAAGVVAIVLLLLLYFFLGVLADVLARGVNVSLLARYLLYKLPAAVAPGLPLALLFATLVTMTRFGQDGELKAAMLLGLGPRRFIAPLVGLGLAVSALAVLNGELVVPWSEGRAAEVEKDIMLVSPETLVRAGTFFTDSLGRNIFVGSVLPGGEFRDVTVITPGGSSGPREVITAASGVSDPAAGVWRLEGLRLRVLRDARLTLDVLAASATLPVRGLAAASSTPPDLVYLPLKDLLTRLRSPDETEKAAEWTALHRKAAEPLAATSFAFFAAAVGLFTFRRGANLGFVAALLLTFVYYATWSVTKLLGAQGTVPAWAAGWAPVALYAAAGAVLLLAQRRR